METREVMLYTITNISLVAFIFIVFGAVIKSPNISNNNPSSLTGNVVFSEETQNFKIGDNLTGDILLNSNEKDAYGVLLLTKDSKPIITETFNIAEIAKERGDGAYVVKLEDLADYKFNETGNYELMFSVLKLNVNIKRDFVVERK